MLSVSTRKWERQKLTGDKIYFTIKYITRDKEGTL